MQVENEQVTGNDGDVAETEAWAALEAELDGAGEASGADGSGSEPKADAAASKPAGDAEPAAEAKGDQPGEDAGGKPSQDDLTKQYQAAMREERTKRQALEKEFNELKGWIAEARNKQKQQEEPQPPSLDEDPVAFFQYQNEQLRQELNGLKGNVETTQKQHEEAYAAQQFMGGVRRAEETFAQQKPDYWEAADHLRSARMQQLGLIYPDNPKTDAMAQEMGLPNAQALREVHLQNEVTMYAQAAIQTGQSPAEVFYNMARYTGWQGKQPPAVSPQQKADMAKSAARASQSLSGAGGGGRAENSTVDDLADLYLTDPDAADALFQKMEAQGLLG